jgi:glycosyltransferase involved in cell wall biosynthesis
MKIGFDAKRFFYNHSGLGNYSRNMIAYLQEYFPQEEYYLFAADRPGKINFHFQDNTQVIHPQGDFNGRKAAYWRSKAILHEPAFQTLDIYHGLSAELPIGIRKSPVKSVLTIHDMIYLHFPHLYKFIDRKIYHWKTKKACQEADKIIAISQQTKDDIIRFYKVKPEKIDIVYQGCNAIFYPEYPEIQQKSVREKYHLPKRYILNVGTIEERKNALLIVKAMHQSKIDFPLAIIGRKTAYTSKIEKYIAQHNLQKQVFILDNVGFEDLPVLYQGADIFIYPSVFEGFGIPIIEAFNSDTPVIVSDIPVFREVAGEAAMIFENNNPTDLGEKINVLLHDLEKRNTLIQKGRERKMLFRGEAIASKLMHIYQSLV